MFEILRKSLSTGVVTTEYPVTPPEVSSAARGRPEIDFSEWTDARPSAGGCPTGAIFFEDRDGIRAATLDLGKCIFCGLCAEVDPAIHITPACELASTQRGSLRFTARYQLKADGTHEQMLEAPATALSHDASLLVAGEKLKSQVARLFGRSLHIREVDAGSCNGCEVEIVGLNSPVYDIERFGIHFVASPRHADMLLVTGPVTRNMELALRKTYDAMPAPRLVVAGGACAPGRRSLPAEYRYLPGGCRNTPLDGCRPP